jgi:hypothetical protein
MDLLMSKGVRRGGRRRCEEVIHSLLCVCLCVCVFVCVCMCVCVCEEVIQPPAKIEKHWYKNRYSGKFCKDPKTLDKNRQRVESRRVPCGLEIYLPGKFAGKSIALCTSSVTGNRPFAIRISVGANIMHRRRANKIREAHKPYRS